MNKKLTNDLKVLLAELEIKCAKLDKNFDKMRDEISTINQQITHTKGLLGIDQGGFSGTGVDGSISTIPGVTTLPYMSGTQDCITSTTDSASSIGKVTTSNSDYLIGGGFDFNA